MSLLNIDLSNLPLVEEPWGPSKTTPSSLRFNGVPYAPFIKSDKLGKIADWQVSKEEEQLKGNANQKKRDVYHAYGASAAKMFGAETEDKGFSLVENTTTSTTQKQAVLKGGRKQNTTGTKKKDAASVLKKTVAPSIKKSAPAASKPAKWGNGNNNKWGSNKWNAEETKQSDGSIAIGEKWVSVAEIEFNKLTKLNLDTPKPITLSTNGTMYQYQKKYETNTVAPLEPTIKVITHQTSSQDPNLKNFASEGAAKVFITDEIIAQLMCAPKSNASWDVIVTKKDGKIFFDKREDTFYVPIDENAPLADLKEFDVNHPANLKLEFEEITNSYVQGSLGTNSKKFEGKSPIASSAAISKAYKYVKYELPNGTSSDDDQGTIPIIVRTSFDAYNILASSTLSVRALLQYKSNDWRAKFHGSSQGNIFIDEVKKNNNMISQWTTQSALAGVNSLKIGFVTRENTKSFKSHIVAGTMTFGVDMLMQQLKVNLNNGWGILKSFIDIIEHEGGEGDYRLVIFKVPNSQKINIYKVPFESFDF